MNKSIIAATTTVAMALASVGVCAAPVHVRSCHGCHESDDAKRDGSAPILSGQKAAYLAAQLRAFRGGERKHDLMQAIAQQLSDADIAPLAEYWSQRARGADVSPGAAQWREAPIEMPSKFPLAFRAYKTVVDEGGATTRQFYANEIAFTAARTGVPLPQGAAILIVTYPGTIDAGLPEVAKPAAQGFALMTAVADGGREVPALLRNADWRYAVFDAQRVRRAGLNEAPCLACHKPQAAASFVFTIEELKRAAGT